VLLKKSTIQQSHSITSKKHSQKFLKLNLMKVSFHLYGMVSGSSICCTKNFLYISKAKKLKLKLDSKEKFSYFLKNCILHSNNQTRQDKVFSQDASIKGFASKFITKLSLTLWIKIDFDEQGKVF